ncbi:DMT family transporter [Pseudomonas duriflava]|nr:DMT family transporter [Pseudomonas duriflava]
MSHSSLAQEYRSPATSAPLGFMAAFVTVAIWTTWIISTRFTVHAEHPVSAELLAFLRFSTAALLLSPYWWRLRPVPKGISRWALLGLLFAGIPYLASVLLGLTYAPALEAGPLLTGSLPLFVALLSALCLGERFTRLRLLGLALIALGVVAITGHGLFNMTSGAWRGHLMILLAALSWSIYTVAFRKTGLTGTAAASFIAFWSLILWVPFNWHAIVTELSTLPVTVLITQVLIQGVLAGIVALITYATAVSHLGASRTAAITAITPASATLAAILVLGEVPGLFALIGCGLLMVGVVLASGVLNRTA